MIAWLLGYAIAGATPAPATPPPTILHERVSPVCSTLHQLVLPLAAMNVQNKPVREAINVARHRLENYSNTRLRDGVMMYAAQIDMLYTQVLENLTKMDQQLAASYRKYPQGTNAKVDALRQRVQNVMDLERQLVNKNVAAYAAAIDNDGVTDIENSANQIAGAPTAPPSLPDVPPAVRESMADNDANLSSTVPAGFHMRTLKWSSLGQLQNLMHREGPALEAQALIAAHDCDGV